MLLNLTSFFVWQESGVTETAAGKGCFVKDIMGSNHCQRYHGIESCNLRFQLTCVSVESHSIWQTPELFVMWGIFIHSLIGVSCLLDISSRHWPWWCGAHKNIDKEANQLKFMKREKIQKNRCVWSTKYS